MIIPMTIIAGKTPIVLYMVGLALFIIAIFIPKEYAIVTDVILVISTIIAGYHVVILEGIGHTIENTKIAKKFMPNSHIDGTCSNRRVHHGQLL